MITVPVVPSQPRTKERTLNLPVQQELPGCYVGQRKSPKTKNPAVHKVLPDSEGSVIDAAEKDIVWLFMRKDMSSAGQNVPGWGGFVSVTGSRPIQLTTIDYYPVINRPITGYSKFRSAYVSQKKQREKLGKHIP